MQYITVPSVADPSASCSSAGVFLSLHPVAGAYPPCTVLPAYHQVQLTLSFVSRVENRHTMLRWLTYFGGDESALRTPRDSRAAQRERRCLNGIVCVPQRCTVHQLLTVITRPFQLEGAHFLVFSRTRGYVHAMSMSCLYSAHFY